jgi:hypothetical protein
MRFREGVPTASGWIQDSICPSLGGPAAAGAVSLRRFVCRSQLEEIICNLQQQRSAYNASELEDAIDFYWKARRLHHLPDAVGVPRGVL